MEYVMKYEIYIIVFVWKNRIKKVSCEPTKREGREGREERELWIIL